VNVPAVKVTIDARPVMLEGRAAEIAVWLAQHQTDLPAVHGSYTVDWAEGKIKPSVRRFYPPR
jgi:hypothetical protein